MSTSFENRTTSIFNGLIGRGKMIMRSLLFLLFTAMVFIAPRSAFAQAQGMRRGSEPIQVPGTREIDGQTYNQYQAGLTTPYAVLLRLGPPGLTPEQFDAANFGHVLVYCQRLAHPLRLGVFPVVNGDRRERRFDELSGQYGPCHRSTVDGHIYLIPQFQRLTPGERLEQITTEATQLAAMNDPARIDARTGELENEVARLEATRPTPSTSQIAAFRQTMRIIRHRLATLATSSVTVPRVLAPQPSVQAVPDRPMVQVTASASEDQARIIARLETENASLQERQRWFLLALALLVCGFISWLIYFSRDKRQALAAIKASADKRHERVEDVLREFHPKSSLTDMELRRILVHERNQQEFLMDIDNLFPENLRPLKDVAPLKAVLAQAASLPSSKKELTDQLATAKAEVVDLTRRLTQSDGELKLMREVTFPQMRSTLTDIQDEREKARSERDKFEGERDFFKQKSEALRNIYREEQLWMNELLKQWDDADKALANCLEENKLKFLELTSAKRISHVDLDQYRQDFTDLASKSLAALLAAHRFLPAYPEKLRLYAERHKLDLSLSHLPISEFEPPPGWLEERIDKDAFDVRLYFDTLEPSLEPTPKVISYGVHRPLNGNGHSQVKTIAPPALVAPAAIALERPSHDEATQPAITLPPRDTIVGYPSASDRPPPDTGNNSAD